ncbi:MAG: hypothetical protein ACR2H3_04920 [Acidimicrobiales bacterium]
MATVNVTPETFELVNFDAGEIQKLASELADTIGLSDDVTIDIEVDEAMMMGRVSSRLEERRIVVEAFGGAFEDQRKSRAFSAERTRTALAHGFMRARDRLDPAFGDAPPDDEVSIPLESAWATHIEGRLERLGLPIRRQRRIYHFRVRHGFNDSADAVFEELWSSDSLNWDDLNRLSVAAEETRAAVS